MIELQDARSIMLYLVAATFIFFALFALVRPHLLASTLGYELKSKNAWSEFYAIYIGVFLAQAYLAIFAASRIEQPALGDIVAVFLLAQPVGRLIAIFRGQMATGVLRFLFALELIAGVALLLLR